MTLWIKNKSFIYDKRRREKKKDIDKPFIDCAFENTGTLLLDSVGVLVVDYRLG